MKLASDALRFGTRGAEQALRADYYRPEIDGLRAVAILAVIGFHALPRYFPGGFVGVDVFFVISGFLITSVVVRQMRRSRFTFANFYARRIQRIFPALVVVLVTCLLLGWFALLPDELEYLGKHVASAAGFVSNFALMQESGYFDRAAELKPLLHLWSLGIEEQFYLLWPMLLLLLWTRGRRIGITVALLTVASFVLSLAVGHDRPAANFYLPFSRFWELGLGCLLAIVTESSGSRSGDAQIVALRHAAWWRHARSVLPIVGICLIGASVFLFDRKAAFSGWAPLLPTVGAMSLILAPGDSWFQRRVMASAAMVFVGTISYPLYLWHWPLLSFANIIEAGTPRGIIRVVAVLLSFALAWLTFRLVEVPVRAHRSTRVTLVLAGALLVCGVVGLGVFAAGGFDDRFGTDVRAMRAEPRMNELCTDRFTETKLFNYCKSTSSASPAVMFLGDSRAQGIYDGVASLMGAAYPLMLLGRGGCPPMLNVLVHDAEEKDCNQVWQAFVKYVGGVKPGVVVLVGGGAWLLDPSAPEIEVPGQTGQSREAVFKAGLAMLMAALPQTSHLIYVRQLPGFDSSPSCLLRPIKFPGSQCAPTIARSKVEHDMASYNHVLDEIKDASPQMRIVDSIPALCDASVCSQKSPAGEIIYSDSLHLNPAGGRYFARASGLYGVVLDQMNLREH